MSSCASVLQLMLGSPVSEFSVVGSTLTGPLLSGEKLLRLSAICSCPNLGLWGSTCGGAMLHGGLGASVNSGREV